MTLTQSVRTAAVVAAMIVPTVGWAAQQQPTPHTPGTAQPVAQAVVTECAQAHSMAERTIDMTGRRLEAARQANSPAAMRAAIDEMQAALRQLRTEIAPCARLQSVAPADPHAAHVMPGTAQAPIAAAGAPVTRPGSTAPVPAPAAAAPAAPMDHSKMPMVGNARVGKPEAATGRKPAAPVAPMDHSKMPMGSAAVNSTPAAAPLPLVIDPVCGLKVDPSTAPRASYQGQTYYFCSEQHHQLFLKDSAKYVPKDKR